MSEWMRIIGYALITVFLGVILKEFGFKGSKLVLIIATVSIIGASALSAGSIFSLIKGLSGDNSEYAVAMLKIIGVGYVFGVCADICSELGEGGLSNAVCLFGRVEIVTISLPFIKRIIEKGVEIL